MQTTLYPLSGFPIQEEIHTNALKTNRDRITKGT
jgi:hypothetical protein